MHEKNTTSFKHWTLQKPGGHDTHVIPNPKAATRDYTLHPVSVAVVVSVLQGRTISVSTKNRYRSLTVHSDKKGCS